MERSTFYDISEAQDSIGIAIGLVFIVSYLSKYLVVYFTIISMLPVGTFVYGHLYGKGIQQWINKEERVKIQFKYRLYKHEIHNYHQLNFSIQDLETVMHLKNLTASVTITNDPLFTFDNITIPNGDFVIVCPHLDQGQHQAILSIRSANYALALASFNMTIP